MAGEVNIDAKLAGVLLEDERVIAEGWAGVRMPRQGQMTVAPVGLLIRLGYVVADQFRGRRLNRRSADAGFAIARRMRLTLTSQRILLWEASVSGPHRDLLGAYPTDELLSVECPYSRSPRNRSTVFTFRSGYVVRISVETAMADRLAGTFNRAAPSERHGRRARTTLYPFG
jgi:hypothetical protein